MLCYAETVKISKYHPIHLLIFDQYLSRWGGGAKRHVWGLGPSPWLAPTLLVC